MRISTVGYSMKQGIKNISRNKLFSLASVATMAACIFVFGLFFSIVLNFHSIVMAAEEGVAITVFFENGVTQNQISDIGEKLRDHEGVAEVKFVSADEAWEEFRDEYFGENADLAEGFKEDNPLAGADNYEVTWRK
nr:permease-like cell division protein FtsX [Coprococcus sp. AF21-14LB]